MRMFLSADMVGVFYTGYSQHLSKNHRCSTCKGFIPVVAIWEDLLPATLLVCGVVITISD